MVVIMSVFMVTYEKYIELLNEARNPKLSLKTRQVTMKQAIIVKLRIDNLISYEEYQLRWEMTMIESLNNIGTDTNPKVRIISNERQNSKRKHALLERLNMKHSEKYGSYQPTPL